MFAYSHICTCTYQQSCKLAKEDAYAYEYVYEYYYDPPTFVQEEERETEQTKAAGGLCFLFSELESAHYYTGYTCNRSRRLS